MRIVRNSLSANRLDKRLKQYLVMVVILSIFTKSIARNSLSANRLDKRLKQYLVMVVILCIFTKSIK